MCFMPSMYYIRRGLNKLLRADPIQPEAAGVPCWREGGRRRRELRTWMRLARAEASALTAGSTHRTAGER